MITIDELREKLAKALEGYDRAVLNGDDTATTFWAPHVDALYELIHAKEMADEVFGAEDDSDATIDHHELSYIADSEAPDYERD